AGLAAVELAALGGPQLDARSLLSLGAAWALSSRLGGHGRVIVPRTAQACWDEAGEGQAWRPDSPELASSLSDVRPDAEIGGRPEELERFLAGLLETRASRP
ncbi:MAG TPA: hypothetical protein VFL04_04175, partial [Rectinemataceae bacterium]|nr:hypothetical protein [Rectinemataceae bacterium]